MQQKNHIDKNYFKQTSLSSSQKSQAINENECIFCWSCHKAITLNQYLKGRHHQHSVQTIQQAMPLIKNLMIDQLQKSLTLKQFLQENKSHLENNHLKQCYQTLVDKINEFFHEQIQVVQRKRQCVVEELEAFYLKSIANVQKNIDVLTPVIDDIEMIETKIKNFLTDQAPITQINPISDVMKTIDEYTRKLKEKRFQIPELPQFITKTTLKESINTVCSILQNKPKQQNNLRQSEFRKSKVKQQFNNFFSFMSTKDQIKNGPKINISSQELNQSSNRKVRLVQKVKGKMKYTSSLCSTTFA